MKKYFLICSIDANMVDYEQEITEEQANDFWDQFNIAQEHGCDWFSVCEEMGA